MKAIFTGVIFLIITTLAWADEKPQNPTLTENWRFETRGRIYSTPVIYNHLIIAGSGDNNIYALHKNHGSQIWSFTTGGAVHSDGAIAGETVLFPSADGNLYALNAENGSLRWKFTSGGEKIQDLWDYYISSPVVKNEIVYWGCGDGKLYALDLNTGGMKWEFATGAIIHATPALDEEKVYIGNYEGYFFALNARTGEKLWQFRTIGAANFPRGEVQKGAVVDNGTLWFGSRDYNIYALDANTGRGRWNFREPGWIIATPTLHGDHLFFGTSDTHRFYCMHKITGHIVWEIKMPMRVFGSAIVDKQTVWFGCFDGILYGADITSGEIVAKFQTAGARRNHSSLFKEDGTFRDDFELYGKNFIESERIIHTLGSILSTPVKDGNNIYFGSSDGGLYSVNIR
jgi:eukaryotic-like serine/threonine-protein kinase